MLEEGELTSNEHFCKCCQSPARYTCPACGAKTCSVDCVRQHKTTTGCTGKRDRIAFVPTAEYGANQFASDYGFLEEVIQVVGDLEDSGEIEQRKRAKAKILRNPHLIRKYLGDACLVSFLPESFERAQRNRTRIHDGRILWTVEIRISNEIEDAQRKVFHSVDGSQPGALQRIITEELKFGSLKKVTLKNELNPKNQSTLPLERIVDPMASLADILTGASIIEYPIFTVHRID